MQQFKQITSRVIPLNIKDIDTDMIIPAQYLTRTGSDGFGEFAFQRLREADPSFPMNLERYQDSKIILAGENFGCGSSREHAVWSLLDWGVRVVIAESFADIFYSNSAKNGLVLVELKKYEVENIFNLIKNSDIDITVDLDEQKVVLPDNSSYTFPFDSFRKECILNGFDDLDYILSNSKDIDNWDKNKKKFYSTLQANH
jgi:3-isopropylmalate/(R)-2-methylmalate dehydratase small subunit